MDSTSRPKRPKGNFADVEAALRSWIRDRQGQGCQLNNEDIKKQGLRIADNLGCSEGKHKVSNGAWLEKFKQKNGVFVYSHRKNSI